MGGEHRFLGLLLSFSVAAGAWGSASRVEAADMADMSDVAEGADAEVPGAWRSRVSAKLLSIYDTAASVQAHAPGAATNRFSVPVADSPTTGPRLDDKGWVQVDVHYDCRQLPPIKALISAGLSRGASVKVATLCVEEGWVAPESLSRIAALVGVTRVNVPSYAAQIHPRTHSREPDWSRPPQPSRSVLAQPAASSGNGIDHNGSAIMRADQFVAQTRTTGVGITVGVQSTGVASLGVIQGRGELPAVRVLDPSGGSSSAPADEGTALLEEVHAVAPGAGLAFCGPNTFVEYTSCLGQLINAGATILVDDVVFPDQDLMASDGSEVQAIEQILTQNPTVALFTAAGNYNGSYWEGQYSPASLSSLGLAALSCPSSGTTQTDNYVAEFDGNPTQLLTVTQSSYIPITFAWADPSGHSASNFDVYWIDSQDSTHSGCFSTTSSTDPQISEQVGLAAGTYTLYIATPDASLTGKFLKLWIGGDGLTSLSNPTTGSVVTPQAFATGAITVGAVNGSDGVGSHIEPFSSLGPVKIAFPAMKSIQAPVLVAPDGINVDAAGTYFAGFLFPDGNFYGTSASAPNAGAVAALIRSAFPSLTVSQLVAALQGGATQLGSSPPDGTFGYGRIDALGALGTLPAPTITSLPNSTIAANSSSSNYPFTVSGTGNLHFSVTSSNAALIPPSIVAAGSPGVTIAPSSCGVTTMTCTVSVTAASGQGSSVNVTLGVLDGANRSAPASMTITVTGSQAPPPSSTPGSSGGGGGAFELWEIEILAVIAWLCARRNRNGNELADSALAGRSIAGDDRNQFPGAEAVTEAIRQHERPTAPYSPYTDCRFLMMIHIWTTYH
jgi:hypothetical protein